jgi:Flp pilus assembly pilin Flp
MKWRVVLELVGADGTAAVHEVSGGAAVAEYTVLLALVPASIAGSMKDEIFQAASNTLKTVTVRRRKRNLR